MHITKPPAPGDPCSLESVSTISVSVEHKVYEAGIRNSCILRLTTIMADHNDAVSAPDAHEHAHGTVAHDHDFAAANQKHFDAEAKAFDAKPNAIELAKRISKAMISTYPTLFDEDKTTVLDFACGSGESLEDASCRQAC